MRRIKDWALSIAAVLTIALYLALFDPVVKIGARFGRRHEERAVSRLSRWCLGYLRVFGTRIEVERNEKMVPGSGYIIISNHQSMADIPMFVGYLPDNVAAFVSKKTLGKWVPSVSYHLRYSGSALIDRDNPRQSLRAIRDAAQGVQARGGSIVIFPEGTRSRDGKLKEFFAAGTVTLLKSAPDLPVVPATIDGAWDLLSPRLLPVRSGTRIRMKLSDPIARSPDEDPKALIAQARDVIAATLTEWRAE